MTGNRWEVSVRIAGESFHVVPANGLTQVENWAVGFWSQVSLSYLRHEYPKTRKQLRKSIALCQEWCDSANKREAEMIAILREETS